MNRPFHLLVFSCLAYAGVADPVRLDTGSLSGVDLKDAGVRVFKGIPFATPPVGDLRWRAPQPAAKWDGIRKATSSDRPAVNWQRRTRRRWRSRAAARLNQCRSGPFLAPSEDCASI